MFTPSSITFLKPLHLTNYIGVTIAELSNQMQECASEKFTGWLDLQSEKTQGQQWRLYFCQGSLVWATSRMHPIRRWYRQLSWQCPQLVISQELNPPQLLPNYDCLTKLVKQEKIRQQQLEAIVEGQITEIVFDIIQWGERLQYRSKDVLTYRKIPTNAIEIQLFTVSAERIWRHTLKFWEAWQRAGLEDCSPNQAPVILKTEELQKQTSQLVYRNLSALTDSNQTFRDLAAELNRNMLLLTQTLIPFIRKGLIGLTEVEDLSSSVKPFTVSRLKQESFSTYRGHSPLMLSKQAIREVQQSITSSLLQPTGPLVACIDDSQMDSQTMSRILTEAGYRCICSQDPVHALPVLLENKPDLIFLDLVMPIVNGYEICAQIRRISVFKDIPVIILTGNDGVVDRIRAKIVGSSGFLTKPINSEKVLKFLKMHLRDAKPIQQSERSQMAQTSSARQQIFSLD